MAGFKVRASVKVDLRALHSLRKRAPEVLKEFDHPLRDTVRYALDISLFRVPVQSGALRDSAFVDGPLYNLGSQLSTAWTAGYAHPAAGPIHEGFHWGEQMINPPPGWLKDAFKGVRRNARKGVADTLKRWLSRNFPQT